MPIGIPKPFPLPKRLPYTPNLKAMPWYNGDYPPSYKNQPAKLREKAVEIANEVLAETGDEGLAIATGLKRARQHFKKEKEKAAKK